MQRIQFEKRALLYVYVSVLPAILGISVSAYTLIILDWGVLGMVTGQLVANIVSSLLFIVFGSSNTNFIISRTMGFEL